MPQNSRPNPFKARGRSLLLLATVGLAVVGTTVLSTLGASNAGSLGPLLKVLVLIASVAINAVAFIFAFRFAAARDLSARDVAPGAIAAAIIWQLLQTFGVVYVGHVVKGASATNRVFALVWACSPCSTSPPPPWCSAWRPTSSASTTSTPDHCPPRSPTTSTSPAEMMALT